MLSIETRRRESGEGAHMPGRLGCLRWRVGRSEVTEDMEHEAINLTNDGKVIDEWMEIEKILENEGINVTNDEEVIDD